MTSVYPINWFRLIADIERSGLTDSQIATEIGCSPSDISKYKAETEPMHLTGEKLRALHLRRCLSKVS